LGELQSLSMLSNPNAFVAPSTAGGMKFDALRNAVGTPE